jgi:hypothetical protein
MLLEQLEGIFSSDCSIFRATSSIRGVSPLILVAYFLDVLVELELANQYLSWDKECLEHMSPSILLFDFLAQLLFNFGANYYTKSNVNSYIVLQNRTP